MSCGTGAGWGACGFLSGVALHSLWPYTTVPFWIVIGGLIVTIGACCIGLDRRVRVLALMGLALVIGVWRFDAQIFLQPRGLIPFEPRGLAWAGTRSGSFGMPWAKIVHRTRLFVQTRATELFASPHDALLTGMLYGDHPFSPTWQEIFRRAGMLHLVAVSGSNVTILVVLVLHALVAFRLREQVAFCIVACCLFAYTVFVGWSPAVVRAACMGLLVLFAPLVGRLVRPSRLLLIASFVCAAWKPWTLLFDPSFALSFLAMLGLLTWSVWIEERLRTHVSWAIVRQTLAATIGATIMTLPYASWAFGNVTVWGLFTNLLVVPVVPWAMGAGALSLLFPSWAWIRVIAVGFLVWMTEVASYAAHLQAGVWDQRLSLSGLFVVYGLLWWLWHRRTRTVANVSTDMDVSDRPFVPTSSVLG